MLKPASVSGQTNNFNLKHKDAELIHVVRCIDVAVLSVAELEAMRTRQLAVPASKHSLETICGASCETGAQ